MNERVLRYLKLFVPLGGVEELRFGDDSLPQRYHAHEHMLVPGQQPTGVLLLLDGIACRRSLLPNGRCQITALLLPGDVVGVEAMPRWPCVDTTAALTSVQCTRIPVHTLQTWIDRGSTMSVALRRIGELQQAIYRQWIVNIGTRPALERVAHFFCETMTRARAIGICSGASCALPLNQIELADVAAITPVHANRVLAKLRLHCQLSFGRGLLHVPDMAALERLANYDPSYLYPLPGHAAREARTG
jgi:CRP-like cAMP-binding protein